MHACKATACIDIPYSRRWVFFTRRQSANLDRFGDGEMCTVIIGDLAHTILLLSMYMQELETFETCLNILT